MSGSTNIFLPSIDIQNCNGYVPPQSVQVLVEPDYLQANVTLKTMSIYIYLGLAFLFGLGVGVELEKIRRIKMGVGEKDNPFLDEADSEVADELRAEGAQSVQERIERRKGKILAQAVAQGRITNDGVEDLFCISDATARNYLSQLVVEGHLEKIGTTGRGVYYVPKPPIHS